MTNNNNNHNNHNGEYEFGGKVKAGLEQQNRLFANVQGNILKGFNKDHVRFIFFNIDDVYKAGDLFRQLVEQKRIPSTTDLIYAEKKQKSDGNTILHLNHEKRGYMLLFQPLELKNLVWNYLHLITHIVLSTCLKEVHTILMIL
jgi:hypothetical protein